MRMLGWGGTPEGLLRDSVLVICSDDVSQLDRKLSMIRRINFSRPSFESLPPCSIIYTSLCGYPPIPLLCRIPSSLCALLDTHLPGWSVRYLSQCGHPPPSVGDPLSSAEDPLTPPCGPSAPSNWCPASSDRAPPCSDASVRYLSLCALWGTPYHLRKTLPLPRVPPQLPPGVPLVPMGRRRVVTPLLDTLLPVCSVGDTVSSAEDPPAPL